MSEEELSAKEAYFNEQALLDLSDNEQALPDPFFDELNQALSDSKAMPPPTLGRQGSSFLGPTPKERLAEFESHTSKQRADQREMGPKLTRSSTAPETELTKSFPVTKPRSKQAPGLPSANKLKRVSSLPELTTVDQQPFYIQVGVVPRELKNGKNVKPADNIKLEPEYKQLLKGKIIYFYPNDDISSGRRLRIHKVIQLGAAWVTRWRDDITHIMLDDAAYTYPQLLKHLNKAGLPRRLVLVNFDPYVPQCIQFGTLLDPTAQRFAIRGAPPLVQSNTQVESSQSSNLSQTSLKIKPSRKQLAAKSSQKTDSQPTESLPSVLPGGDAAPTSSSEEAIVKDSFTTPSSEPNEEPLEEIADRFNDALTQAIQEAKALAHLPLDEDDDDKSPSPTPVDEDGEDTDEEPSEPALKSRKHISFVSKASMLRDKGLNLNTLQCMDPSNRNYSAKQNPNARTIQILEDMCKHYDQMQDHWRTLAYRKGVTTFKKQTTKITTAKQAAALPFIGQRLAEKIEEIVLTDRLRRLDNTRDDPLDSVLRLFLGIYGAGLVQANKWIQTGHRTLDDLRTKAKLTESQAIGLEHYNDFNSRIPRAEVEAHGAIVINALKKIDPNFKATIMGSYRRGAQDTGDIDMIITCPGASVATLRTIVSDQLVPHLFRTGFLTASLATSRSNDPERSGTKWHGASCLPGSTTWRRIDFLLVPEDEMGAALIYFTGNDIFNRSIRLLARKKGMRLNQRGLYKDVQRGSKGERLNEGVLVEGRDEKRIFEILGVPWREPRERIC